MKERLGSLELQKVVEAKASLVSVVARTGNGPVVRMDFEFEPAEPFGLLGIRVMDMGDAEEEAPPTGEAKKDDRELTAAVAEYAKKAAEAMEFSGVVLIAKNGTPIFEQAFGYADRDEKTPNRVGTKFNVGSISKSFTSLAVRQLIVQKKIALDDTIGKFLPDYPNKDAAGKVTIRRLLDMTSGIGDFFGEKYDATPKNRIRDLADYLPLFAAEPLLFEPGTSNRYSNGGYVVLGLIVEKASGMSYFDYVRENIYKPAGMENTDHFMADMFVDNLASGYTRTWDDKEHPNEPRRDNIYTRPARGSSAGGGYSTADDLLRLVLALKADKLSAPESARMFAGNMAFEGGAPGINAYVGTAATTGCTVVVLANYDPPAAGKTGGKIARLLKRLK
jgi:CubicO group peptidase (beta-lactamase class C family)